MKFLAQHICSGGGRLGKMTGMACAPAAEYQTPMILVTTQTASVPHITQDVYQLLLRGVRQQEQRLLQEAGNGHLQEAGDGHLKEAGDGHLHQEKRLLQEAGNGYLQQEQRLQETEDEHLQPPPLLSVPVQQFARSTNILKKYRKGVAAFAGLPGRGVVSPVQCSMRQTPSGYNSRTAVSCWTYAGRVALNPQQYMECVSAMGSEYCEALHDGDTAQNCTSKKIEKSLTASLNHLTQCLSYADDHDGSSSCKVLAPLLGGWDVKYRQKWGQTLAKLHASYTSSSQDQQQPGSSSRIGGYSLSGLHSNGTTAEQIEPQQLFLDCVRVSLSATTSSLPRFAFGGYSPHTLLSLVAEGCDIFDTSLPSLAADRSSALTFAFTKDMLRRMKATEKKSELSGVESRRLADSAAAGEWVTPPSASRYKKLKTGGLAAATDSATCDDNDEQNSNSSSQQDEEQEKPYEINLKDKRHCGSTSTLLEGCQCYTCAHGYTRGYIHHLCSSMEMLVPLLLNMHNLHHWMSFFTSIRLAVAYNSLPQLRNIVLSSYRPVADVVSASAAEVAPTSAADVAPTSAADVAPTSAADVAPASAADVAPTSAAVVALASATN